MVLALTRGYGSQRVHAARVLRKFLMQFPTSGKHRRLLAQAEMETGHWQAADKVGAKFLGIVSIFFEMLKYRNIKLWVYRTYRKWFALYPLASPCFFFIFLSC